MNSKEILLLSVLGCDPSLHHNHHPCFKVTVLPNTHQNEWLHLRRRRTPNTREKMEQPELSRMLVKWPESSCIVGETVKRGKTWCISTWCISTLWPRNTSLKHLPESNKNIYKKTYTRIFRATFFMNSGNWEKATHGKIVIQGIPLSYKKEQTTDMHDNMYVY